MPQTHCILSAEGIVLTSLSDNEGAEQKLWGGFRRGAKALCSLSCGGVVIFIFFLPASQGYRSNFPQRTPEQGSGHSSQGASVPGLK